MSARDHGEGERLDTETAHVRPILEHDATAYIELLERLDRETNFLLWEPGERTLTADEVRARCTRVDRSERLHLVAELHGRLVGFLVSHRGSVRRLRHRADFTMAVLHEHQQRGIGRRLLDTLEAWAVDNGITRLELTVMSHNRRAITLYQNAGYVPEGLKAAAIRIDNVPIDELVMGKLLTTTPATNVPSGPAES
jgi:RimJ/RimL family protein N-acetyltransferase